MITESKDKHHSNTYFLYFQVIFYEFIYLFMRDMNKWREREREREREKEVETQAEGEAGFLQGA